MSTLAVRSTLRLHRPAALLWVLALAAATTYLIRLHVLADKAREGVSACAVPAQDGLPLCSAVEAITADATYADGIALVTGCLALLMFPVAAWAGAVVGRELETGTARLAWTQSAPPARWLAGRLAVPAALLTAGTGTVVLLNNWARGDENPDLVGDWYSADVFVGTGPAAVAHALAGLALGTLAGLLTGRALAGAAAAFAGCLVLHSAVDFFRADLWPTLTHVGAFEPPRSYYQVDWAAGETVLTYHPASHYWPLQYVETGLLLAVAAAATAGAFLLLRRRTA
ncbi:hypothetical protein DI272_21575 [Streptomyces sp. Act143]|uniref:hypothetical protein n=1 Tax=Streptomyces sp. Act143 TaxID=2200760 RepID=UPI000D68312E|nr:hypothetical protein [Streptomyces sp. Act143]PWI16469.1 hypothetical protein DI272_21575 [Streptomyces sp. Act143]